MAYQNQISSGESLGWGIDCIRFWARSDQNSGFFGQQIASIGLLWGKSCYHSSYFIFDWFFFIVQVTSTTIKSRMGSKFGKIQPWTEELAAIECLENSP